MILKWPKFWPSEFKSKPKSIPRSPLYFSIKTQLYPLCFLQNIKKIGKEKREVREIGMMNCRELSLLEPPHAMTKLSSLPPIVSLGNRRNRMLSVLAVLVNRPYLPNRWESRACKATIVFLSSRRDTDHAAIEAQTKSLQPPKVSPPNTLTTTRHRLRPLFSGATVAGRRPSAAEKPPPPGNHRHWWFSGKPPPLVAAADSTVDLAARLSRLS